MRLQYQIWLLGVCMVYTVSAQPNKNWILGSYPNNSINQTGGMMVDFSKESPVISEFNIPIGFDAIACINDEKGNLLFYTNGCEIINKNHKVMDNGNNLNPGEVHNIYCDVGYYGEQSVLILPYPGHENQYAVFSLYQEYPVGIFGLRISIVDMNANNGLGRVIEKNTLSPIIDKIIGYSNLTLSAVRHANGRDWYIVFFRDTSFDGTKVLLFTPNGIEQEIPQGKQPPKVPSAKPLSGQSCFSPNGQYYTNTLNNGQMQIWNFDRCKGLLKEPSFFRFYHEGFNYLTHPEIFYEGGGVSFSPNSRYLYFSDVFHVYQADLQASDIRASIVVVGEYDGYEAPYPTYFGKHMLAANGKIYIDTQYPSKFMHVINNPNEKGLDCNFELRGLELPKKHYSSVPNFAYYNLYDIPDSPCDSLGIDGTTSLQSSEEDISIRLFPNPTSDVLNLEWNFKYPAKWYLTDILGRNLKEGMVNDSVTTQIDMNDFSSGLYYVSFYNNGDLVETRKVVFIKN